MRTPFPIFILLYIWSTIFIPSYAQQITLGIKTEINLSAKIEDSLLLPVKTTKDSLPWEIKNLSKRLEKNGFIAAKFLRTVQLNDSVYQAEYLLGKRHQQIEVKFDPINIHKREIPRYARTLNDSILTIPLSRVEDLLTEITHMQSQKGQPFAKVRLSEIEIQNNILKASLLISSEQTRTIDSISIKGYEKFPKPFLKYYTTIRKGEIFDKDKILKQSKRLNALQFVSTTGAPEALFRKDSTIVFLYLQKENHNVFDGILGFSTEEETQKLVFNGYVNLELNNNFNRGEQFALNYKADGREQIEFQTRLKIPFIFNTRFGIAGELRIFKRDSSFVTTFQQARVNFQLNPNIELYSGYRNIISANLLDEAVAGNPIENFKSKFITSGINLSIFQESILFPKQTEVIINSGIGSRKREAFMDNQWFVEGNLQQIINLNTNHSIFFRAGFAYLGSDTYLLNELYRFGGSQSIRGFDENSIDASWYSSINLEYRYLISPTFFVHTVTDAGYFSNPIQLSKNNLYSFGFGLGMQTRPGLFRFVVANGFGQDQTPQFSNSRVHISLTSKF
ncbi:MAG TPA: hypothetical protein VFF21_09040 [Flavobacteriaceae bacterium]|nr:hypothetical protein [Flavobacteriaceae bacterium]